jgi:hypothetical protein
MAGPGKTRVPFTSVPVASTEYTGIAQAAETHARIAKAVWLFMLKVLCEIFVDVELIQFPDGDQLLIYVYEIDD